MNQQQSALGGAAKAAGASGAVEPLEASVDRVEALLQETLDLLPEPGRAGCRRIIAAGGKRLRPELVLRCAAVNPARKVAGTSDVIIAAAVAVELLHSATLMHDDLLDDSDTRRGVPAIHRKEGMPAAVIAGDGLIAHSWRLIARADRNDVEDLATALSDMCAGEALEDHLRYSANAHPLEVLRVAQLKTGALLRAACRIGARQSGCTPGQIDAIGIYGSDFGVALQLVDDVLDVISDEATLGKPCGADFPSGILTMPAVFAISGDNWAEMGVPNRGAELREMLHPGLSLDEAAAARRLLIRSGGAARTVRLARSFARRAARSMPGISEASVALSSMPARYVDRQLERKVAHQHRWMLPSFGADTGRDLLEDQALQLLGVTG